MRTRPVYLVTSAIALMIIAVLTGAFAMIAGALIIALVLLFPVLFILYNYKYGVRDIADDLFYATTEDGWKIALHYHEPEYTRPGAYPVIFCHGIAVNKYGVDLDRRHSLAFYLKQNGFPVFVVDLRGTGNSFHPDTKKERKFYFDNYIEFDVPAVIRTVKEMTGAPKVNWVGHSMGSMIASGFLGRRLEGHESVACHVAIGSPGRLDHIRGKIWEVLFKHHWVQSALDLRFGANVFAPVSGRFATPYEKFIYHPENVSSTVIRQLMNNGIENINPGVSEQMLGWIQKGTETTCDGRYEYRNGYKNIKIPVLYIAGEKDHVAPPSCIEHSYENTGSAKKSYRILGRTYGHSSDYCHIGLVLGENAPTEVFPLVHDWLSLYGLEKKDRSIKERYLLHTSNGKIKEDIKKKKPNKAKKQSVIWDPAS